MGPIFHMSAFAKATIALRQLALLAAKSNTTANTAKIIARRYILSVAVSARAPDDEGAP